MELIEQVREIGADQAVVGTESEHAARAALTREIVRTAHPRRRRRPTARTWTGVGMGGLVAGASVAAIVVGTVLAPPATPGASADVFEAAAAGADGSADLELSAGQFLRHESRFTWMVRWDADMPQGARFNNADPGDAEATLVVEDENTTYVPADPEDDWVRERTPYTVIAGEGGREDEARAEWAASEPGAGLAGVTRYPRGIAVAGGDGGTFEYYLDDRDVYADMPDDVPGIVRWFSERYEREGDRYGLGHYFVETISDVSVFNLAPGAARAGMLRAFATLEGVSLLSSDGGVATLSYQRSNSEGATATIEFSLDMERGYVLQVTSWPFGADPEHGDSWSSRTDAEITVVDSAP
jgi:hypothetical protein